MGRVVEAFDTHLGRTVALKEVLPTASPNVVRRFQREVQITARLEHASIVPLYDSGKNEDGKPYYVMRRVSGRPLDQLIDRARGLDERLALLPNVLGAIDAIAHAHKRGVIHRDLKPANILVGELGETVVIDWGLAKVIGEEDLDPDSVDPMTPSAGDSLKTQIGSVFGTPGFMAPEQARGEELDERGDVFALGATLYHLIAGKPPVAGKSATEMIASTMAHKIVPITRLVPETPPELITIIDKALSAELAARYANAGELAEDVRRFTTGQLVAAHHYTRWQHMARFARRHRAALGVAAAASLTVAVLAWVSVHRVLTERDVARNARAEAEVERQRAEERAVQLRERADELTLAHVRSLLDTNPIEAIAQLKHLEGSAPAVLDQATALAKAAVLRGVGRGVPSLPGFTVSFSMSPDGKRVLQVTREGELQIIDVDLGRAISTRSLSPHAHAEWVDGGARILVINDGLPPQLLDPVSGTVEPIGSKSFTDYSISDNGALVAFVDDDDNLGLLDVKARTATLIWTSGKVHEIEIARDGSFVAFGETVSRKTSRVVVVDRTGKLLVEKAGRPIVFGTSNNGKLAFSLYDEIVEVQPLAPTPTITRVPMDLGEAHSIHELGYHNNVLRMVAFRNLVYWNGKLLWRTATITDTIFSARDIGLDTVAINGNDNNVHLLFAGLRLPISVTSRPDNPIRVAGVPSSTRIAATAGDAILIWDIADLVPQLLPMTTGQLIDERHLLVMGGTTMDWHVVDIDTKADQLIKLDPFGLSMGLDVADDGRVLSILDAVARPGPPTRILLILSADRKTTLHIDDVTIARLIPGGVVFARASGHVLGAPVDSDKSRELVRLDGDARSLCPAGPNTYAVLSSAGDLVKGTLDGAILSRGHIDIVRNSFIACHPAIGDIMIASGNRLLKWNGTGVDEVARFEAEPAGAIDTLIALPTGLYVELANKAKFFIASKGDHTPRPVPLQGVLSIANRGTLAAGLSVSGQVELVDLPSLAKWSLPKLVSGRNKVGVSPDATRLQLDLGDAAFWRLPQAGQSYGAWLDELTNAELVDGRIVWPWQQSKPP
jgi:hypothetical protein